MTARPKRSRTAPSTAPSLTLGDDRARLPVVATLLRQGVTVLALSFLAACTNSGLGQPDPTEEACPYSGSWSLVDVSCGAFQSYEPFFERYDGATLDVTAIPTGCSVQVSLTGGTCAASERWTVTLDELDLSVGELESGGVAACEPVGCSFGSSTPCLSGTGAGAADVTLDLVEPELVLTGDFGAAGADLDCPLGLVATFQRVL